MIYFVFACHILVHCVFTLNCVTILHGMFFLIILISTSAFYFKCVVILHGDVLAYLAFCPCISFISTSPFCFKLCDHFALTFSKLYLGKFYNYCAFSEDSVYANVLRFDIYDHAAALLSCLCIYIIAKNAACFIRPLYNKTLAKINYI